MKNFSLVTVVGGVLLSPLFVSAQTVQNVNSGLGSISKLIDTLIGTVLKSAASLFLTLAILAFFYGLVEYIWARRDGDATKLQKGNVFMTWSLVALFVMFSVYGIIKFTQNIIFQNTNITDIEIPNIKFKSSGSNAGATGNGGGLGTGAQNQTGQTGGVAPGTGSGQNAGSVTATCTDDFECRNGEICVANGCTSGTSD